MKEVFKKEITQFFASPIGFVSIGIFFFLLSLFLWIIEGDYNIPDNEFADLSPFFILAPWMLIFLISAISMKTFSEEFKSGTIETLITKPLQNIDIVLGKFLSVWWIGKILLIPTLIYVLSVQYLTMEGQKLDIGVLLSAYFGLVLLIGVFASFGIFASILYKNQVGAFLIGLFIMFIFYYGFEGVGNFNLFGNLDYYIQNISLNTHYMNFVKGIINTSDIIYFGSIIFIFNYLSIEILKNKVR